VSKNTVILILITVGLVVLGFFLNRFICNGKDVSFEVELGFSEHQSNSSLSCNFLYFTGKKRLYIKAIDGEKVKINYDVSLKGGKMEIRLLSPDGKEIWSCEVNKEVKGSKIVEFQFAGIYILEVEARGARSGRMRLYWERIIGI